MKLLVTGGCGYKGSVLIPLLLADGHSVISIDTQWFGNVLPEHPQLTNLKLDVRDTDAIPLDGVEAIIHLANIANDPAVELNPTLSWEGNVLAGQQLADRAIRAGVKHFLFASSGSVYGVKDEPQVTEDLGANTVTGVSATTTVATLTVHVSEALASVSATGSVNGTTETGVVTTFVASNYSRQRTLKIIPNETVAQRRKVA